MNVRVYYPSKHGLHWIEAEDVEDVAGAISMVEAHLKDPANLVSSPAPTGPMFGLVQGGKA